MRGIGLEGGKEVCDHRLAGIAAKVEAGFDIRPEPAIGKIRTADNRLGLVAGQKEKGLGVEACSGLLEDISIRYFPDGIHEVGIGGAEIEADGHRPELSFVLDQPV